ncbi:MFS transporter [Streptomyces spiramenti]|uniref:MFS transporter n=1 Tax=Streptomyces spiramenti TaxID=2720606 RepID=A0ABX1AI25_9ACTN|nr:MFS transporter [Streptomyces spiramenti]NJP65306.1 MFS transporter [Streptomyces spiramenti]
MASSADATIPSDPESSPAPPSGGNRLVAAARSRTMRAPLFWSVVGRFPFYLVGLALVVFTTSRDAGYLSAGLFLGAYSLGTALFAPLIARRVDRYGQTNVLLITGVVYPASLIGFVAFESGSLASQLVCVAVAGATVPPISGCIRALWRGTGELERAGISLETVLFNFFLIGGPLLLSVMLLLSSPGAAIVVGGLLAAAGAIGFATTRASRTQPATPSERDPLGALRSWGLLLVLALVACTAVRTGIYNVALPAFADDQGSAGNVGLFYAAFGVGGILGGLWYGSRNRLWSLKLAVRVGLLVVTAGALLPVLVWDSWSMGLVLVVLGSFEAPMTVILYEIISRTARQSHVTEAFTWSSTISLGGSALGAQIGGLVITLVGTQMAFLCAFGVLLAAVAIAFATRHQLAKTF